METKEVKTGNEFVVKIKNTFKMFLNLLLKPVTTIKEEVPKMGDLKDSGLLAGIVSILVGLISLVVAIFNVVRVKQYNYFSGETTTEWVWDNLSGSTFGYFFQVIIVMAIIIALIAGIIYVAGKIVKKEVNYSKMLGLTSMSLVPAVASGLIVGPLLVKVYIPLGSLVMIAGLVYSFMILFTGINEEIKLKGDNKLYFNSALVVLTTLIPAYLYSKFIYAELLLLKISNTYDIDSLTDIFKMYN